MMDLDVQSETVGREVRRTQPLDDVQLPRRAIQVERDGMQPRRLFPQFGQIPGCGQGQIAYVELEVEGPVFNPVRIVQVERDSDDAAAQHAGKGETRLYVAEYALERDRF